MKQFSLPIYYLKFFLFLLVSFFLHMLIAMLLSFLSANEYASLIGAGLGVLTYPWGFWNILFFSFALPLDRVSKPSVWLGSILGLPLLQLLLMAGPSGFSNIGYVLRSGFWLGTIFSNVIFYAIGYSVAKSRRQKQAERAAEKEGWDPIDFED